MKEISFDDAFNALRAWYMREVDSWADEYDKRIKAREWESEEAFRDAFHEETDGAQCIIYTAQAKAVLLASDNEDAYADEIGEPAPTVEEAALMAFQRDIQDRMTEDPASLDEEPEADETE